MRSLGAGGCAGVQGLGKRNWSRVNPVQQDGLVEHQGRDLSYSSAFRRRYLWLGYTQEASVDAIDHG